MEFSLTDQNGLSHSISQYRGKVIFLNFWATWCGPCREEMPYIQELYHAYGENQGDVVFLGVSNPGGQETDKEGVISFLEDNGYTFPTVFDETGDVYAYYGISAFPTTFMIDREGNVFGYVPGALTKEMMQSIIEQTLNGTRN